MKTKEETAAYMRAFRAKHREWLRTLQTLWQQKNGAERRRRYRERYAKDPDFRRAELERRRKYRRNKENCHG